MKAEIIDLKEAIFFCSLSKLIFVGQIEKHSKNSLHNII
jgi:hypothetical protein